MIVSANQMPAPDRSQEKVIREKVYANLFYANLYDKELKFTHCESSSLEARDTFTVSTGGKASHAIMSFL